MKLARRQSLSVVIPVYNMAESLITLLRSIEARGLWDFAREIIVVDDGSTDDLLVKLSEWVVRVEKFRVLSKAENSGRFKARLVGAQGASGDLILFIDARVEIDETFLPRLMVALEKSDFIQPQARIDTSKSVFSLYWDRSHRWIFRHHYQSLKNNSVFLIEDNYDKFLKGTTMLVAPREEFVEVCLKYSQLEVLSDDTLILKEMVRRQPLYMDDQLYFWWQPRQGFFSFLWRLVDRGPGLVEYHVFEQLSWIGRLVLLGLLVFLGLMGLFIFKPVWGLVSLLAVIGIALVSTLFLKPSLREAILLVPLHLSVLLAVSLGVIYGLTHQSLRWIKGESRQTQ